MRENFPFSCTPQKTHVITRAFMPVVIRSLAAESGITQRMRIATPVERRSAVQSATARRAALSAELCALVRNDV